MSIKTILLILCMLSLAEGCATSYARRYRPIPVEPKLLAAIPQGVKDENLEIGADAFAEVNRQKALFRADLSTIRVLPVLIRVANLGQRTYRLRQADISLLGPDGQVLNRLPAGTVARELTAPLKGKLTPIEYADLEADVFDDYRSKEFADVVLGPYKSAYGFIYFEMPSRAGTTLRISIINVTESKRHDYDLALAKAENK